MRSLKMPFNFPLDKDAVQQYVDLGWIIVPNGITPDGKYKKPVGTWKKYNAVGEVIKPTANEIWNMIINTHRGECVGIGAITGIHSGFVVIDLDTYKDKPNFLELQKELLSLDTPIAKSGGGGYHIYIKYDKDIKTQTDAVSGIDIRSDGGYIVLPPSPHHNGGIYTWVKSPFKYDLAVLPPTLLSKLPKKEIKTLTTNQNFNIKIFDYSKDYFQGERDTTIFSVARSIINLIPKHRLEDAGLELFKSWCKTHIKDNADNFVNDDTLTAKFKHALTYGQNEQVVRNSIEELLSTDDILVNLFRKDRFGIKTGYSNFDMYSGGLLSSSLTLLSAQTGIGKSILFMNFLNNIQSTRKVAYFDLENGTAETLERLIRIKYELTKDFFNDESNLSKVKNVLSKGFNNYSYFSIDQGIKIRKPETLMEQLKKLADEGVEVFVIDPLQKLEGGDDRKTEGKIVGDLSDFAKKSNTAVILCHHVKKSIDSGGRKINSVDEVRESEFLDPIIEDVKGGSIITDTAENVWMMTRKVTAEDKLEKSKIRLKIVKCRNNSDAVRAYKFFLDLNTLKIYQDEYSLSTNTSRTPLDAMFGN